MSRGVRSRVSLILSNTLSDKCSDSDFLLPFEFELCEFLSLWRLLKTPPRFFDLLESRDCVVTSSSKTGFSSGVCRQPNFFFSLLYVVET